MRPSTRRALAVGSAIALGAAVWMLWDGEDSQAPSAAAEPRDRAAPESASSTPVPPAAKPAHRPPADAGRAKRRASEDFEGLQGLKRSFTGLLDRVKVVWLLEQNGARARDLVDHFCQENEKLSRQPVFQDPPDSGSSLRDAADFMAPRVDYEPNSDGTPVGSPGSLRLPDELLARIRGYGSDWPNLITQEDTAGLDFGWMRQLAAYDTWSLLGAGPLRDLPPGPAGAMPLPNIVIFQQWAKLRLMQGIQSGDFASAAAEVQHLAGLIDSQGLLLDDMVGASMLHIETRAAAVAAAAGQDLSGLPALDTPAYESFRRLEFSAVDFFLPGVSAEVAEKASHCLPAGCSGILEALGQTSTLDAATLGTLGDHRDLLQRLAHERGCEPALVDRFSSSPPGKVDDIWWGNSIDHLIPDGGW